MSTSRIRALILKFFTFIFLPPILSIIGDYDL